MNLEQYLKKVISHSGPLTVAQYMSLCLQHPEYGYYIKQNPLGEKGDFITAPEISQMFSDILGFWCADLWHQLGGGKINLVELGPGSGINMANMLHITKQIPHFHENLSAHLFESSSVLVEQQRKKIDFQNLSWLKDIDSLPKEPCLIIANEFFDSLPIHQFVKTETGFMERVVSYSEDKRSFEFGHSQTALSLSLSQEERFKTLAKDQIVEISPQQINFLNLLLDHISNFGGALLIIDYGYDKAPFKSTLQALKNHKKISPLIFQGDADITSLIDFSALKTSNIHKNIQCYGPLSQGQWLKNLGIEVWHSKLSQQSPPDIQKELKNQLHRLIAPEQMGDLFKCLVFCQQSLYPNGFEK